MRTQQAVLKISVMALALAVPISSAQAFWLRIPKELLGAREAKGQEMGPQMGSGMMGHPAMMGTPPPGGTPGMQPGGMGSPMGSPMGGPMMGSGSQPGGMMGSPSGSPMGSPMGGPQMGPSSGMGSGMMGQPSGMMGQPGMMQQPMQQPGTSTGGNCGPQPNWPDCAAFSCSSGNWNCTQMKQSQGMMGQQGQTGQQGQMGQMGQQMGQPGGMMQGQPGMMGQPGGMTHDSQMGQPDMRGPGDQGPSGEDMARRQEEEMTRRQQQDEQRGLEDMKRGIQGMAMGIKNLEFMFKQLEKQGVAIPAEIKDKLARIKAIVEAAKSAKTMEELQAAGTDELQELMMALEEYRRDVAENEMRLRGVRQGIKGMEQGLKMFERQIAALKKQKVEIPASVTETLDKIKAIIAAVKTAKTWEEVEAAGIEDLPELMQGLDESRQALEQLVRWPQTLKQLDRELANLTRELKRAKGIVDRLAKKDIDLATVYGEFEVAVNKLKEVRAKAVDLVKSGQAEEAFDLLEGDFFGQMQDVWEHDRIIMTMSNLGRFQADFKRGIADAQRRINILKRQKIDVSELVDLLEQAKAKGAEITGLMKAKPPEPDAIMEGLQELENIRQMFDQRERELRGEEVLMPWEQGPAVFKSAPGLPAGWEKLVPKKEAATAPSVAPETGTSTPVTPTP